MREKIPGFIGLHLYHRIIVTDADGLWDRFKCDAAAGLSDWEIRHISDEMELRHYYEYVVQEHSDKKYILVLKNKGIYVPEDIKKSFYLRKIDYDTLFPALDSDAIRELPGADLSRIFTSTQYIGFCKMTREETLKFCTETVYEDPGFAAEQMKKAEQLAQQAVSHRDWDKVAKLYGQASLFQHSIQKMEGYEELRRSIENSFQEWVKTKHESLSGSVDRNRPVILSKTADFIKKESAKAALIVMDGMSFENFYVIKHYFIREPFAFYVSSSFSFLPTVTSVARQSIFSGNLPRDHIKPFALDYEEKQWREYWKRAGLKDHDIGFYKTENPEYNSHMRAIGIVINACDDLMHAELQGLSGLNQGLNNWLEKGTLKQLLKRLLRDGFSVYMTSDHGNTAAIAQGRFLKPGLPAEPASRRSVIYKGFDDAPELNKFTTEKYNSGYLPDGYDIYLFDMDVCYGDKDKEYITHGGMTLEEVIVPFVRIGEYNG